MREKEGDWKKGLEKPYIPHKKNIGRKKRSFPVQHLEPEAFFLFRKEGRGGGSEGALLFK